MFRSVVHGCCTRVAELEQTLAEVLARFTEKGHPGVPCLRTGWQQVAQVEEWRDAIRPTSPRDLGAVNLVLPALIAVSLAMWALVGTLVWAAWT